MKRLWEFVRSHAIVSAAVAALAALSPHGAKAQGFAQCNLITGANPQQSCDFLNPPMTFTPQGVTAASGGPNGNPAVVPIGSVAYASFGNATTYANGQVQVASIFVPYDMTVTNINCLNGGTVGTNSVIYALYNTAGTLLRQTANAGTLTAGANAFQTIALTSPIAIQGPARYFVSVQANGTTDNLRTVAASTFRNVVTQQPSGTFGTLPALTPPTTFTANAGPICDLN